MKKVNRFAGGTGRINIIKKKDHSIGGRLPLSCVESGELVQTIQQRAEKKRGATGTEQKEEGVSASDNSQNRSNST